jgi:hypothetical protein
VARKFRRAGALDLSRENPGHDRLKPLNHIEVYVERHILSKWKRGRERERDFFSSLLSRESPRGPESSREQESLTRTNPSGSEEGNGFFCGMKSLERRYQAEKFGRRASERSIFSKGEMDHKRGGKL